MSDPIAVARYEPAAREEWNRFVAESKNGTFLFDRGYMEYHADRFRDHSLLFRDGGKLLAILPASQNDAGDLVSHGGLTYGGIISGRQMKTATMLRVFDALAEYARNAKIAKLVYKCIPAMYHDVPAEEDLYALFRANARLVRRDVASAAPAGSRLPYTKGRQYCVNKSRKLGLTIGPSEDFAGFMAVEEEHLRTKFGIAPVHRAEELQMLASRFPDNIKLFTAQKEDRLVGGVVIYESRNVAHAQYIAATGEGKELSALDAIIDTLLRDVYVQKRWFDFGVSTEQQGRYLNEGLIENKESYGARAVVYDFYELAFD
jgi:hypothetical protein